ncbi:hypothetical protein E3E12_02365 [Formicincola oecophyllae]|uniref:Transporter n=1 Tax=Formicincola oecophyllae TaxID=2558361 RepID=A0A4Y6UAT1_9PROT|nr:hypothetical protein [Formicincola oecophyllae]QDH13235.1 hypothetical protein E3E12_02365 [Formicincola oecophyllae]
MNNLDGATKSGAATTTPSKAAQAPIIKTGLTGAQAPTDAANPTQPTSWLDRLGAFFGAGMDVPEQFSTGTLYAPYPALDEEGELVVEPYMMFTSPRGDFGPQGQMTPSSRDNPHSTNMTQYWFINYAVTDRFTVAIYPTWTYTWGAHQGTSSVEFEDLPFDLEYRLTPDYAPSVTAYLGAIAPTGHYKGRNKPYNMVGTGMWALHYGLESQLAFPVWGHALNFQIWAQAWQPITSARLGGNTTYGTTPGFKGHAHGGFYGDEGVGAELGLTKQWVLALELYHTWAQGGTTAGWQDGQHQKSHDPWSGSFNVGPEVEYNFNENWGVVAGVIIPVVGHNISADLQPQVAISSVF